MEYIPSSINILFSVVSIRSMWLEYTIIAELLRYRTVNLIVTNNLGHHIAANSRTLAGCMNLGYVGDVGESSVCSVSNVNSLTFICEVWCII